MAILRALELRGRVLLVLAEPDEAVEKSFRNLPEVRIDYPGNLSTFDVLFADRILFTTTSLDALTGEESAPLAPPEAAEDAGPEEPVAEQPEAASPAAAEAGAESPGTPEEAETP